MRPKTRAPEAAAIVGLTESIVLVAEYMLLSSLAATLVRASAGPMALLASITSSAAFLSWILYRNWSTYKNVSLKAYTQILGLVPVRISSGTVSFLLFQLCSHSALYCIHVYYGSETVSWRNLLNATGDWDWTRLVQIAVVAPFREEAVFRGVLLLVLHRRLPNDPHSVIFGSSICFSLIHLINFASTTYSFQYVSVQLFLSLLISMFYTMRVISSGSLWDAILLHSVNNLLALFVKIDPDLDLVKEPLLLMPLLQTFTIYLVVVCSAMRTFTMVFDRYTRSRFRLAPSHNLYDLNEFNAAAS